ncbi:MAG: glycosyltransferase family 2 protein [Bacillota bacterium]
MGCSIGAVIPAFQEAPRMSPVLDCAVASGLFSRIVVVDDGSRDHTLEVAREYPVRTVRHPWNRGKGAALQTGLNHLEDEDVVLFLDADLVGVTGEHLESLIRPLCERPGLGMTVARFIEGRFAVDLQQKWFAILNGQRALTREFIRRLPDLSWSRFGVEVLVTRFGRDLGVPTSQVLWPAVTHYTKEEKFGPLMGFYARMKMYAEVLKTQMMYPLRMGGFIIEAERWDAPAELDATN